MQRITVSLDDEIVEMIDRFMARRGATNRSEALRDMVRAAMAAEADDLPAETPCTAALTYVYDHEKRDLARKVTTAHHHRHDLSVATLHVHLDAGTCLEVAILKGPVGEVRALSDEVTTARGVRHGTLQILPGTG